MSAARSTADIQREHGAVWRCPFRQFGHDADVHNWIVTLYYDWRIAKELRPDKRILVQRSGRDPTQAEAAARARGQARVQPGLFGGSVLGSAAELPCRGNGATTAWPKDLVIRNLAGRVF